MRAGQLPIDQQVAHFRAALRRNRTLTEVLARAAAMDLPGWYLVAGCLYQTVWNVVTRQPPEAGILDYDLAYFDESDLSWDAENQVIEAGYQTFGGLAVPVQIRNQARVHLWYEQKFGMPCRPYELAPRHVYQEKTARWRQQWPSLTVLPWPERPAATGSSAAHCRVPGDRRGRIP